MKNAKNLPEMKGMIFKNTDQALSSLKSQSSMEFFILVGILAMIIVIFVAASAGEVKEFSDQRKFFLIKDLALKLQKEVFIASSVEDGYERNFTIPEKLENTLEYSIITQNRTITVNSSTTAFSVAIPNVYGNFSKGLNIITKTDGGIYANSKPVITFTEQLVCQNAESLGLCSGLDIVYGSGYRCGCCSDYGLCCPC